MQRGDGYSIQWASKSQCSRGESCSTKRWNDTNDLLTSPKISWIDNRLYSDRFESTRKTRQATLFRVQEGKVRAVQAPTGSKCAFPIPTRIRPAMTEKTKKPKVKSLFTLREQPSALCGGETSAIGSPGNDDRQQSQGIPKRKEPRGRSFGK